MSEPIGIVEIRNPKALAALVRYGKAASDMLKEKCQPETAFGLPRWVPGEEPGIFRRVELEETRWWPCLFRHREDLQALADYGELTRLLGADEVMGSQLDRLVGDGTGAFTRLDMAQSIDGLLERMFATVGDFGFDQASLEIAYKQFEAALFKETAVTQHLSPVPRVPEDLLPVALEDNVVIDSMSDVEVGYAIGAGMFHGGMPDMPVATVTSRATLRVTTQAPKATWDGTGDPPPLGGSRALASQCAEDLATALRLIIGNQVAVLGTIHLSGGHRSWAEVREDSIGRSLTAVEVPELLELWTALRAPTVKSHVGLQTGLRRFTHSAMKPVAEDRLIDLVIAAEALFIQDEDRGEQTLKVALRAAFYLGTDLVSRQRFFEEMRCAYIARNQVVHGGSPSNVRLPGGGKGPLGKLLDPTETLLRSALVKAVTRMAKREAPSKEIEAWNDIVLGGSAS